MIHAWKITSTVDQTWLLTWDPTWPLGTVPVMFGTWVLVVNSFESCGLQGGSCSNPPSAGHGNRSHICHWGVLLQWGGFWNNVWMGFMVLKKIHINTGTQAFPAEYCTHCSEMFSVIHFQWSVVLMVCLMVYFDRHWIMSLIFKQKKCKYLLLPAY